jgi:Tol biopolymer transport system component
MVPRVSRLALLAACCAVLVLWAGCSSSESTTAPDPPAAEEEQQTTGPALSLLYTTDNGALVHHDAQSASSDTLGTGVQSDGARAVSPSGRHLAFSYATADSSRLALLDLTDGTLQPVHARAGHDVYSLAWHPEDDRLAFGVYTPTDEGGRGPGTIRVATPDGTSRSVGCSTAREVLTWLAEGTLATRNDDNLFVVSPSDCATQADGDARRMHEAAYAPTGPRLAYLHRELTYDQASGEYVPDTSLYLSDARLQSTTEALGPDRRPRHLRWSPEGGELALDVHTEDSGHRQIVVYRDGEGRTVYLTPPAETRADQTHPRWSTDGNYVAFTQGQGANARAAVRIEGQTRTLGPVRGAVWGWTGPRSVVVPGPDSLRVQTPDGTARYTHPTPATLIHAWERSAS